MRAVFPAIRRLDACGANALHLACALQHGASEFATADPQLATAARKAKLRVRTF